MVARVRRIGARGGRYGAMATVGGYAGNRLVKDFYPAARDMVKRGMNKVWADSTPSHAASAAPTTYQHDTKTMYKRRRAPKRVRRVARKQARVFQKNMANLLGCKRVVDNQYLSTSSSVSNQAFYPISFLDVTDMNKIFGLFAVEGSPTVTYDLSASGNTPLELFVRNIRFEVEIKNIATALSFVDLYYYYPRKDLPLGVNNYIAQSFGSGSGGNYNAAGVVASTGTVSNSINGVTPFDFPGFTENFVIYRSRRVMLQPSQSFSFDVKARPGNQSVRDWYLINQRRNITTGVIIVAQGETVAGGTAATSLVMHRQVFVTAFKNGGKGATSETYIGTGL